MKSDILIIGAGPAGLAAGITAAQHGLKTIIIEKSFEIGYPIKTSAFTFKEVIDDWKLPSTVMLKWHNSFYIYSAHTKRGVEVKFPDIIGGCLDYAKFLKNLSFRAISSGAKIFIGKKVRRAIIKDDEIKVVKTEDGAELQSEIIIDCSGTAAVIGRQLGLTPDIKSVEVGIGMEYEMYGVNNRNPNSIDFYVGKEEIIPIGYGWVFSSK